MSHNRRTGAAASYLWWTGFLTMMVTLVLTLLAQGCATSKGDPAQPRPNTGYVDLRADHDEDLYWEVSRFDERKQQFVRIHSKLEAPPNGILRLALPPGPQRLRIAILNRLINSPLEVQVEVQNAMVTPVLITLTAVSESSVRSQEPNWAGMAHGRYGKRTKVTDTEASLSQLAAKVASPIPYQPRGQIAY